MLTFRAWAQIWIDDVAVRKHATVEPSDVDRLVEYWEGIMAGTTTHEQLLEHMQGLVAQYERRGRD